MERPVVLNSEVRSIIAKTTDNRDNAEGREWDCNKDNVRLWNRSDYRNNKWNNDSGGIPEDLKCQWMWTPSENSGINELYN